MALTGIAPAQNRSDYCGGLPPAGFDQPPNQAHTGRYTNSTYGYSLAIPAGLTAFGAGTNPERGVLIALPNAAGSFLRVDAAYDAFYDITAEGVHRRDLGAIRLHDVLFDDKATSVVLAGDAGKRYLMHLQCRGSAEVIVHEEIIVLRNREIYRLDLQSTPERHAEHVRLFDAMAASWRWVKPQ